MVGKNKIEQLVEEHSAIELLIVKHLIKAKLLIVEDVVKRLVKESLVAEYSVTVKRNGRSKIAKIKQLDGIAAAIGQLIKKQSVKQLGINFLDRPSACLPALMQCLVGRLQVTDLIQLQQCTINRRPIRRIVGPIEDLCRDSTRS